MTCEVEKIGSSARITIEGVVDERGAAVLKERFRDLSRDQFNELIIDMGGVSHFGSSGLGGLLLCYKAMAARQGSLRLTRTPAAIYSLMRDLQLDTLFEINGD
ncbi:MAG: STAS domain-containing protein [Desulfurivibrio sp.]|nr:STAS domain-containing protein [Desulfurivibrio sp.]